MGACWLVPPLTPPQPKRALFCRIALGTFYLSFLGNVFITSAEQASFLTGISEQTRRRILVLIYFGLLVALVITFGVLTLPDIVREGADFITRLRSENVWNLVLQKMRAGLG